MPLSTGDILQNRYRIGSPLRRGGMATIYRGWHITLNMPIAIKEMTPPAGSSAHKQFQLRKQFKQEASLLARLEHPNLVDVLDFFEEYGKVYIVMDLIQGESLLDRIERQGPVPEHLVLKWTDQLLDALAYCHKHKLIHRDIKPPNVVIRPDGQPILMDFGLVKVWDPRRPETDPLISGLGTPPYAPPEQYGLHHAYTDPRSDIYSLGATLYHALTGREPMSATDRAADLSWSSSVRLVDPGISERTDAMVTRAMAIYVFERFSSASEMKAFLQVSAQAQPRRSTPWPRRPRPRAAQPKHFSSEQAALILIAGFVLFVLFVLLMALTSLTR